MDGGSKAIMDGIKEETMAGSSTGITMAGGKKVTMDGVSKATQQTLWS